MLQSEGTVWRLVCDLLAAPKNAREKVLLNILLLTIIKHAREKGGELVLRVLWSVFL